MTPKASINAGDDDITLETITNDHINDVRLTLDNTDPSIKAPACSFRLTVTYHDEKEMREALKTLSRALTLTLIVLDENDLGVVNMKEWDTAPCVSSINDRFIQPCVFYSIKVCRKKTLYACTEQGGSANQDLKGMLDYCNEQNRLSEAQQRLKGSLTA